VVLTRSHLFVEIVHVAGERNRLETFDASG
jgi:hypothetical protein